MKRIILIIVFILIENNAFASAKENIINKLRNIENISFNFEQNINSKIENGDCTIEYPKKIYCKYDQGNNKTLVSNGNSLVIKTISSYYIYPLKKTPLYFILDKNYLIKKISNLKERNIEQKFINFNFEENENQIKLYFAQKIFNLVG